MIALLTDFGTRDPYVGVMKGVMLGIHPGVTLVDLTHDVTRHAIREGAFLLANAVAYFPVGTVFLAVVDPGVGSDRLPIAAEAGGYRFVGPDNGLLSFALAALDAPRAFVLAEAACRRPLVSYSFHGRDLFAPAAAHLALGTPLEALGPPLDDPVRLEPLKRAWSGGILHGEVMHIDSFGNVETSLGRLQWRDSTTVELAAGSGAAVGPIRTERVRVTLPRAHQHPLAGLRHTYSEVEPGALLAMISSNSYLEVSSNGGSAADQIGVRLGDPVELTLE